MSSSDVFDVLNIQKAKSPGASTPLSSAMGASKTPGSVGGSGPKQPMTGLQRELYSLLGENQPPMMLQQNSKFKEKMSANVKPTPWTLADFHAGSKVTLRHWIKGSKEILGDTVQESSYSRFNKHLTIPKFTEEEYNDFIKTEPKNDVNQHRRVSVKQEEKAGALESVTALEKNGTEADHVEGLSKETESREKGGSQKKVAEKDQDMNSQSDNDNFTDWEFAEIDYLFKLCSNYDMKWPVIYDRYTYNDKRTIDDLKEKFYEVSKKYFYKIKPDDPILEMLNFSKAKELERKKYLERLLARSAAEIAEEEALIIESRKFEMAAKKTLNERENLLRLLDSPNSNQSVSQYTTSQGITQLYNSLISDKSRKRKLAPTVPENPWMKQQQQFAQQRQRLQQLHNNKQNESNQSLTSDASSLSPRKTKKQKLEMQSALKRKADSAYAEHLLQNFTQEEKSSLGVKTHGEKLIPGAFLRSTKISTFKPALQTKIATSLQELNLPTRPAMLTSRVLDKHEQLLKSIITVTDLKKHLDKLEAEKAITK